MARYNKTEGSKVKEDTRIEAETDRDGQRRQESSDNPERERERDGMMEVGNRQSYIQKTQRGVQVERDRRTLGRRRQKSRGTKARRGRDGKLGLLCGFMMGYKESERQQGTDDAGSQEEGQKPPPEGTRGNR